MIRIELTRTTAVILLVAAIVLRTAPGNASSGDMTRLVRAVEDNARATWELARQARSCR